MYTGHLRPQKKLKENKKAQTNINLLY